MWGFGHVADPGPITGHDSPDRLTIDHQGWLFGDGVERWPSPRHFPALYAGQVGIVWHYTCVAPGIPLWKRITTYKPGVDRAASWHLLIEADGQIYQSVSFRQGAWHCLPTPHNVLPSAPNNCSIGIELAAKGDQEWPLLQIDAARSVLGVLVKTYPTIERKFAGLLHSQLDPDRRDDPGPTWATKVLPGLLDDVYGPLANV